MCKAGLSACWEHFHLSGGCAAEGEMRVWGDSGGPQPRAVQGDKAKQDLEHRSRGTAGKSQESSPFLAGF